MEGQGRWQERVLCLLCLLPERPLALFVVQDTWTPLTDSQITCGTNLLPQNLNLLSSPGLQVPCELMEGDFVLPQPVGNRRPAHHSLDLGLAGVRRHVQAC